jgi:hypothetical protein
MENGTIWNESIESWEVDETLNTKVDRVQSKEQVTISWHG